jgi:hypothetical protein
MDWDQLAEEKSQKLFAGWLKLLFRESPALPLRLGAQHRPGFEQLELQISQLAHSTCAVPSLLKTVSMLSLGFPSSAEAASAVKRLVPSSW